MAQSNPQKDIAITLPDGTVKTFTSGVTGLEIAESIGAGLAKAAIAVSVNDKQRDLSDPIYDDASVSIITLKTDEGLEIMRHTVTAQLLARAVKNLYPSAKLAIGPTIENGFYYDVLFEEPISSEDLPIIEKEMRSIAETNAPITKTLNSKEDAIKAFKERGEDYKVKIIEDADQDDDFQLYQQGDSGFIDLCHGPHLPSLKHVGAFTLTKLAGAYWRGDSNNEMLTRIYGTAFATQKELDKHLFMLEEAKKRDHRKIGKEMGLYALEPEEIGVGLPLWMPKGEIIRSELENWVKQIEADAGYNAVRTPILGKAKLYETSGHLPYYKDDMYAPIQIEDEEYYLRPMNCPHHHYVYKQIPKSYRDLPYRVSEYGDVFRYESSGGLSGLMRARGFCINDAHIYCREDQVEEEFIKVLEMYRFYYEKLGITEYQMRLSKAAKDKSKFVDNWPEWEKTQNIARQAMEKIGFPFVEEEGEAAFYGPKIDVQIKSAIGTEYTISTNQLDFLASDRFNLTYTGEDGKEHPIYVIHRAPMSSHERMVGYLIEHYAGHFPLWLSPTQVVVSGIVDKHNDHVQKVVERLKAEGIRAEGDYRNEKINYKIREHMAAKVSMVAVIGDKEAENGQINIRRLGSKDQNTYDLEQFITDIKEEIATKALPAGFGEA